MRSMASARSARLASICVGYARCCQSHPPHVPNTGQSGSVRPGPASTRPTASPRSQRARRSRIATRARSPGAVKGTNTTRPSGARPTPSPPAASESMRTSTISSRGGPPRSAGSVRRGIRPPASASDPAPGGSGRRPLGRRTRRSRDPRGRTCRPSRGSHGSAARRRPRASRRTRAARRRARARRPGSRATARATPCADRCAGRARRRPPSPSPSTTQTAVSCGAPPSANVESVATSPSGSSITPSTRAPIRHPMARTVARKSVPFGPAEKRERTSLAGTRGPRRRGGAQSPHRSRGSGPRAAGRYHRGPPCPSLYAATALSVVS